MTILEKLEEEWVVNFELTTDRTEVVVTEQCEKWYECCLTKYEMSLLIHELQEMRDKMVDS